MKLTFSLGSNVGNSKKYILNAIAELEDRFNSKATISNFYESPPYGPQDQNKFINVAIEINSDINVSPFEVLEICKSIENALGRKRRYHWGPREIDIDIIFIDDIELSSPQLTIPHKEFRKRSFVILPIKELPSFSYYRDYFKIDNLSFYSAVKIK